MEKDQKQIEYFPLSLSQQNIWRLEQACPGTSINNISTTLRINGRFEPDLLQQAIDTVLAADLNLRSRIVIREGAPLQYHAAWQQEQFPLYDFSQSGADGISSWEQAVTGEVMPLIDSPLYRFILFRSGEHEGGLLIKVHHIISDGWSQILLCNRIGQAYLDILANKQPVPEEYPDYCLHVQEEQEYLRSKACGRDEEYWRNTLAQAGEPSLLKTEKGAAVSPVGRRISFALPESLNNAIYSFCSRNRVSPFTPFYLALAIYFKRIGGADRFTLGVPVFNRTSYRDKMTGGMFVSTLPFVNELHEEWDLEQCSQHLTEQWLEMLRHQRLPFSRIQQLSSREGRLFRIAFSYQNSKMLNSRDASVSFSGRWHYSGYQMEQLCIHLSNLQDGRRYAVDYDYLAQLFSQKEIEQLHQRLVNILAEALAHPQRPINRLAVLSGSEKERLLYTFNSNNLPVYEEDLYERFLHHVKIHPKRAALIWNGERINYDALERTAAQIHCHLKNKNYNPAGLIAIMLPRCPQLFAAQLGVLRSGGSFVMVSPDLPRERMADILSQSGAQALIWDSSLDYKNAPASFGLPLADMANLEDATATYQPSPMDTPAYVVYTSGSSGHPKGVAISRGNLLNLAAAMEQVYAHGAVLSLCNTGFDAFMLESVAALLNGRTIIIPNGSQLEDPYALAQLITGYGAGFLATTPSRLNSMLQNSDFRKALRRMEVLVCGGEAFPAELLHQLQQATHARIYNQYGPSETTVAVSQKLLNRTAAITAGAPMANCRLYVLDKWLNPLPVGVYGQLYIGGACVGLGYHNDPELTAQKFIDDPFEEGGRLYASGDIACWTESGEIMLAGRNDDQVKIRGLRIEPEELASCLSRHPQTKECAAVVREIGGQKQLIAYYTADEEIPTGKLLSFAASYLPAYMLPAAIIRLASIPLNPNGKADISRLPLPETDQTPTGTVDRLTQKILDVFRDVLGNASLNADSDYFLNGGNSLNAMETISRLSEICARRLQVAEIYACRNARALAKMLQETVTKDSPASGISCANRLQSAPDVERYPLTPVQQGIYIQSAMDSSGIAYQMPGAFVMSQAPDIPRLQQAFRQLIAAEPLLRTGFTNEADGIFARVKDKTDFELGLWHGKVEQHLAALLKPFDLGSPPLLRAALVEDEGKYTLLLNMHHIIGDGISTELLLRRLDAFYQGKETGPQEGPALSYLDYAWMLAEKKDSGEKDTSYWQQHLSPLPQPLELTGDFSRPKSPDYRGGTAILKLDPQLSAGCDSYCKSHDISPYMLFLSAFGLLMSKLSGCEELIVGVPAAGRILPETREMCGPFINTLPLRLAPGGQQDTGSWLRSVKDEVTSLLDHEDAGLEEIATALGLPHSTGQSPLYRVMFTQRPLDADSFSLAGSRLSYQPINTNSSKLDLVGELYRSGDSYCVSLEYATQLFLPETAEYYCRCLHELLRSLVNAKDDTKLSMVNALDPSDRIRLLEIPEHTASPFFNLPIPGQFAQQLALDPEAVAAISHGKSYTRAELDGRACQIANMLTGDGAVKGEVIGLALSRNIDIIAAPLGVWKAGCAYAPLLAHYPSQRLNYMIETAGIKRILCDRQTQKQLPSDLACRLIPIYQEADTSFAPLQLNEDDLAEVLFTSGSTGRPKGVMLRWRSLANMAEGIRDILSHSDGPILCTTNVVFDMFNGEVTVPLTMGKPIIMADEEEMMLPWKLAELIEKHGVRITQSTPSRVQMWLSNQAFCQAAASLELMIYGGEVLSRGLLAKAQKAAPKARQVNMYGPTEGTIYNTTRPVSFDKHVNIGWPMRNNRVYILDSAGKRVLPTASGELYLAGECVSAGYISRPELTQDAFVPDPFFPGEKMYRTGDIARLRLDGSYDFLGRRDAQVKLNGQRVELDEINGAFVSCGCAVAAATVPKTNPDGSMELYTYYIPAPDCGKDDIRSRLAKVLPAYMIPSKMISRSDLPSTPTGKIDLRRLKEEACANRITEDDPVLGITAKSVHIPAAETEDRLGAGEAYPQTAEANLPWENRDTAALRLKVAGQTPRNSDIAKTLHTIWQKVLNRQDIDENTSFFELGGTSLAALSLLSNYNNLGWNISLAQFYENPTLAAQLRLLESASPIPCQEETPVPEGEKDIPVLSSSAEKMAEIKICSNDPSPAGPAGKPDSPSCQRIAIKKTPYRVPKLSVRSKNTAATVLLTGASGFFGAHLLAALNERGTQRFICLQRDGNKQRLADTLTWYFGGSYSQLLMEKISVLKADLSLPLLGLAPDKYRELAAKPEAIWHCAADVRHYAADSAALLQVNVNGTGEMIALAQKAKIPLYHISTTSVAGNIPKENRLYSPCLQENQLDIGQDWHSNIYVRSKFLAEKAVLEAVEEGLEARVFRLGRLVGRSSDGVFQRDPEKNAFWLTLRGIHALGAIPASFAGTSTEMIPVDICAKAAVSLSNSSLTVYHLQNPNPPTAAQAAAAICGELRIMEDQLFDHLLANAPVDESGNILAPLADLWLQMQQGNTPLAVSSNLTMNELNRLGFDLQIPSPGIMLRGFRFDPAERLILSGKEEQ